MEDNIITENDTGELHWTKTGWTSERPMKFFILWAFSGVHPKWSFPFWATAYKASKNYVCFLDIIIIDSVCNWKMFTSEKSPNF